MNFYCANGFVSPDFDKTSPAGQELWKGHMDFVKSGIADGWLLCTGPKSEGGGGVLIIKANSANKVREIFSHDPLHTAGYNRFEITEFGAEFFQPFLQNWTEEG